MSAEFIEVVGGDMMCFKVDAATLEAISCSYYEPSAWNDSAGRTQMSFSEWNRKRNEQWDAQITAYYTDRKR